jgi:hypothetical protein
MEALMISHLLVKSAAAVLALGAFVLLAETTAAEAARRDSGSVTGCSRFGRGCVSAPVRRGRYEQEVRLPGGTWYGCRGDCRDTLRAETVDFWDEHQRREGGSRRGK